MIDNLGRYGTVTRQAAAVGGMENFIRLQRQDALVKAAPRLQRMGALKAAPYLLVAGALVGYLTLKVGEAVESKRELDALEAMFEAESEALAEEED